MDAGDAAARLLEQAFTPHGYQLVPWLPADPTSAGTRPGSPTPAPSRELAQATVAAGVDVAQLQSAAMDRRGALVPQGAAGARADDIADLTAAELERLAGLVSHVASSYSTGPVISRTFGPMGLLRDRGFGTVFVAAIRDRGTPRVSSWCGPEAGIMAARRCKRSSS